MWTKLTTLAVTATVALTVFAAPASAAGRYVPPPPAHVVVSHGPSRSDRLERERAERERERAERERLERERMARARAERERLEHERRAKDADWRAHHG
jgi:hypothetical protein